VSSAGERTINLPDGATLTIRPAPMADIAGLEQPWFPAIVANQLVSV